MELPDELMLETLARLPTKNVIRCSSVSKTLHKIVREQFFVDLHTQLLSTNHSPLFLASQGIDHNHSSINFCLREGDESSKNDPTVYRYVLPYRAFNHNRWDPHQDFTFSCSCNGLVCVAPEDHSKPIVLCNPHTLGYITVPSCATEIIFGCSVGFGYSPFTEEYKLVVMKYDNGFNLSEPETHPGKVMVYTLGADTLWREVADAPFYIRKKPLYVNGQIYWVVDFGGGLHRQLYLLGFDVEYEEYVVIDNISDILSCYIHDELQLVELEGRVSVAFYCNGYMEIWMPVDENFSNWERRHNVAIPPQPMRTNYNLPWIVGIWERDKHVHVWLQDCTIIVCDQQWESKFREFEGPNLLESSSSAWELCSSYTPSMMSLKELYGCSSNGEKVTGSTLGIEMPPAILLPPRARPIIRLEKEEDLLIASEQEESEKNYLVLY